MTKRKITAISAIALALVVAGILVFLFLPRLIHPTAYTGTLPAGVEKFRAAAAAIIKTDYKLARQTADKGSNDVEIRNALLKEYKNAQVLRNGGAWHMDAARRRLSANLAAENPEFMLWTEYQAGGDE
ncbi:MAG: hypothetical protein LBJ12_05305 [Oscillospiraceae bacterium]|jgi:hypothetical protein|nr:hypothetical protein [Oscillospiraceae bacterium]